MIVLSRVDDERYSNDDGREMRREEKMEEGRGEKGEEKKKHHRVIIRMSFTQPRADGEKRDGREANEEMEKATQMERRCNVLSVVSHSNETMKRRGEFPWVALSGDHQDEKKLLGNRETMKRKREERMLRRRRFFSGSTAAYPLSNDGADHG